MDVGRECGIDIRIEIKTTRVSKNDHSRKRNGLISRWISEHYAYVEHTARALVCLQRCTMIKIDFDTYKFIELDQ